MRFRVDGGSIIDRITRGRALELVIGEDADIHRVMESGALSYTDFYAADENELRRREVRYLAALFPKASLSELSEIIFDILDNDHISRQDVRLILAGVSLVDASKRLGDTPIEVVQKVGEMLSEGYQQSDVSKLLRVSEATVYRIDRFLGLSDAWKQRIIERAVDAVRDGLTVRAFAAQVGVSKSSAHRFMQKARSVLAELGEEVK